MKAKSCTAATMSWPSSVPTPPSTASSMPALALGVLQPVDIAALVAEFQRIERHVGRGDLLELAFVEDRFQPRLGPHAQMVVRAGNDELIGLDILVEHHLPGFGALHPKIVRDFPLCAEVADLGADDVIDPVHVQTPLTLIPSIR